MPSGTIARDKHANAARARLVIEGTQEGVIMKVVNTALAGAYITVILAALILGPLYLLHGYRQWWVVTFYAILIAGSLGGIISHAVGGQRHKTT
jgi:hypothetical protein